MLLFLQDCDHVSQTAEEFYTVRCQVADMKNIYVSHCDFGCQTGDDGVRPLTSVLTVFLVHLVQESLDEVTIKDTLEGDNMYTCSQCGKKVRAEKRSVCGAPGGGNPSWNARIDSAPPSSCRACFKKLPRILSFNTMRYTFNMVTMMKEKVNTHFSFPLRLDMTPYTEDFLMGKGERKDGLSSFPEGGPIVPPPPPRGGFRVTVVSCCRF